MRMLGCGDNVVTRKECELKRKLMLVFIDRITESGLCPYKIRKRLF